MNPKVDLYLIEGCGRCSYYRTPKCKVKNWQKELEALRSVMLECDLTEELKSGVPCYTFEGKNIALVSAFKEYFALSLFKGVLLQDPYSLLEKPGKSSQSARLIKFTSLQQVKDQEASLKFYITQAIEVEKQNLKVEFKKRLETTPDELLDKFEELPALKNAFYDLTLLWLLRRLRRAVALKNAFYDLTPGQQRGYIIYFSQPKQSQSRTNRIEKCVDKILRGEALND